MEQPSRTRYGVIGFAVALAVLSYIDRVSISQAAPVISHDLGFDKRQMGSIFGAFGLAYALFEIPSGWLGDWIGPRRVLTRITLWWSAFTALTGWMWSFWSMAVTRFLFGAGEAGGFPNLTKAFSTWLPTSERTRAQGILWTAARWGGAVTPILVVKVFQWVSWRWAFVLFGGLGVIWAAAFYRWYRDDPGEHPQVNKEELELLRGVAKNATGHGNVPWGLLLRSRSIWLLWAQYFCVSFPWYFYITWLPTYLQEFHKLSPEQGARFAALPLFLNGAGCLVCGMISARVSEWAGSISRGRRILACTGFFSASLFLALSLLTHNLWWNVLLIGMAAFSNDLTMPPSWASCMDIGGEFAGTVAGSMNMMGNLAGFAAPVFGGYLLAWTGGSWRIFIGVMAVVYFLGVLCWPAIDPVTPLTAHAEENH